MLPAGIVFLVLELNQTNEMVRAQTRSGITEATIRNIEMYREPRIMNAYLRAQRGELLTAEEECLLDNSANATFRMWENNYYQYQTGLFDPSEFEAEPAVWRQLIERDSEFLEHWRANRMGYSEDFRGVIDNFIGQLPVLAEEVSGNSGRLRCLEGYQCPRKPTVRGVRLR